ncbi:hypothetical protein ACFO1B_43775 [Dactylosporangium siamense]|uniref:Uncharacterized protein n=1 Tax=Dactylosporangium siamense TaxID=685454 RepID=A0A919Q1V9_9ACTN|nr:hypothetical protein [Dactylosporangium siamense]GIG52868.1 hypothetical protein Dsi01nite_109090 [Dactylosporangium siamense]
MDADSLRIDAIGTPCTSSAGPQTETAAAQRRPDRIEVSVIAPAPYLRDFVGQTPASVHHVAAQRVLHDPAYREFFAEESARGAEIVVDNGVFDLGASLPPLDLLRAAQAVNAAEIILPDVMHDGPGTIRASDRAAAELRELGWTLRLCAVVHAANDDDWLRCYEHFVGCGYVGSIALPASRRKTPSSDLSKNRIAATGYLDAHGMVEPGIVYRLLGLGRAGHLELFEQRRHDWIVSVDCAAPVILGAMGVRMHPDGPYEKIPTPAVDRLGVIDPARFGIVRDNIAAVRYAANCPVEIREAQ